jgi:hypothetical protein
MYFAQLLIWAIPLADTRFRRALARCPELFLAATCLPDISLFSGTMRTPETQTTHQWSVANRALREAQGDEERAMALGYAAHLLTDVVAHNQFVPMHQQMWLGPGIVTHAAAEWAMDAHVSRHLFFTPAALLSSHRRSLSAFAEERLTIPRPIARRALYFLLCGERFLRRSRVPHLIRGASRYVDRGLVERFDDYVRDTSQRLLQVNRLVAGDVPAWLPEIESEPQSLRLERRATVLPNDLFSMCRCSR